MSEFENPTSKTFFRLLAGLFGFVLFAYATQLDSRLLSSTSDFGVAVGVGLGIALLAGVGFLAFKYLPKAFLALFPVLALMLTMQGCIFTTWETIEPGYVGIRVNLQGSSKGEEKAPILVGRVWYSPINERVYVFPTFMQRYPFTEGSQEGSPQDEAIRFTSKEGVQLIADVSVNLTFQEAKVPELFATFRKDADQIVLGYVRDRIRNTMNDVGSGYTAMELVATKQEAFMGEVNKVLRAELDEKGITLDSVSLLKRPKPPANVEEAINNALTATQQAQAVWNQVEQTKAQAEQKIQEARGLAEAVKQAADGAAYAQMAKAKADAFTIQTAKDAEAEGNAKLAASLTPGLVDYVRAQKWNGTVPMFSGGGTTPIVDLRAAAGAVSK